MANETYMIVRSCHEKK